MADGRKTEEKEGTLFKHPCFTKSNTEYGPLEYDSETVHIGMTDSTARACLVS